MKAPRQRVRMAIAAAVIAIGSPVVAVAFATVPVEGAADRSASSVAEDLRTQRPDLKPFGSCDRLRGYLRRHQTMVDIGEMRLLADDALGGEVAAEGVSPAQPVAPGSPTNVQEQGVDEPDLVKASGSVALAVVDDRLRAVELGGAEPAVLGSVELPGGSGGDGYVEDRELLVSDERALVITRSYATGPRTLLTEIEISDPTAMRELKTMAIEGDYVSARLTATTARVVIASSPELPAAERGRGRAFLPAAVLYDRQTGERRRRSLLRCESVRRPARFAGATMLNVVTVDLARGLPAVDADAVMAGGEIVYGSPTSLYVATQRWVGPAASAERISDVTTEIHRFDVTDPDSTEYAASGEVEGFMLSQWSMSEDEGVLRVASTTAPPWAEGRPTAASESFVTTLAPAGERLVRLGRVGGLGRDEQIYAVRFIGDAGYVVTFRQVDPLYTLDLSDPRDPRVVGELKVPGYSAYLHPVGEGLLLGVGQGATGAGATTGVQVSLFDVSDPAAPRRLDRVGLGFGTYTEVEHDHHAFTYFDPAALALLPIEDYRADGTSFYGAAGVRVQPEGALTRLARTSHGPSYEASIRRSLIVDGRLFTVSAKGIAEHDPGTLERLSLTRFAGK